MEVLTTSRPDGTMERGLETWREELPGKAMRQELWPLVEHAANLRLPGREGLRE